MSTMRGSVQLTYWVLNAHGYPRSFLFSHAPIVGHNEDFTHTQNDENFVDWVNGYSDGIVKKIEAYLCGHVHPPQGQKCGFIDVTWKAGTQDTMRKPDPNNPPHYFNYQTVTSTNTYYTRTTAYIELDTATERY